MTHFLIRHILPPDADPSDPQVRKRCGTLSGATGIALNLLLFLGKLLSGLLTGSISMVADAINNLSDAATSVVTLVGFRLAGQKADKSHPFGHGRMEYLAGLIVSLAILLMGFEIGKTSLEKIFNPTAPSFSWLAVGILAAAIGVKLWMFWFNRALGRSIGSAAMRATAADSLSDAVSTFVVLLAALSAHFLQLQIDGAAGLVVAIFILKTGWDAVGDTLDPLLGRPMDPALAEDIDALVLSHENILGIHDLVYHDYGPGRAMMSFHAEVPADGDLLEMHDIIDHIERELKQRHRIETVIHMDPVVCDGRTTALKELAAGLAREIDPALTVHDFRITAGPRHTNLIFDVVVPYGFRLTDQEVQDTLAQGIHCASPRYFAVIQVDHSYVDSRKRTD